MQTGMKCWAPHSAKAFTEATVQDILGSGRVRVSPVEATDGEAWECAAADLLPRSEALECKANMDDLPELHMAAVLTNVEELYNRRQPEQPGCGWSAIYSSVGPVLIAMNPFKELPLYGPEWARSFREAGNSGNLEWASKTLGPHCYGTVEQAYQGLKAVKHQSVIICGESGAGKTVTNRKMIEYLLDAEGGTGGTGVGTDKRRIAEANALLEAYGNAKTVRNDNSSRFGKYSQLHFVGEPYKVRGFEIEPYLLEQSRIVAEPPGERNYHVFHELVHSDLATELGLGGGPEAFELTRAGAKARRVDGTAFEDAKDFNELRDSMGRAGFEPEAQRPIFEAIAAVLHLGNVRIDGDNDTAKVSPSSAGGLDKACELLGLDAQALATALVQQKVEQKMAKYTKNLGAKAATAQRDAVAKTIYSRVFTSIVDGINERLQQQNAGQGGSHASSATLGLLDIFGFEDMPVNGLEQMYINLTNERIQYLFNTVMFERELAAYRREGVEAAFETPPSNLPCVELFTAAKPPGIVKLLADQVNVNGKDGAHLVNILNGNLKNSEYYTVCVPKMMTEVMKVKREKWPDVPSLRYDECFQVRHYAGEVLYTVRNFVAKSRDALLPHLAEVMQKSSKTYIRELFAREAESGKLTIGEKFSRQLEALAAVLEQGGSLFVRCIKPNPRMIPGIVNRPLVLEQLVCGGVVAALEMRKYGFPDRLAYAAFVNEFWILDFGLRKKSVPPRKHCEELLHTFVMEPKQYAFGETKVFLRGGVLALLRALVAFRTFRFAIMVQRRWRLKKGKRFIHAIGVARERLQVAIEGARQRGFAEVPEVAEAAARASGVMDGVWQALEEARERHSADTPRTATPKIAADISAHARDEPRLRELIEKLEAVIARVTACKARAEELVAQSVARAKKEALSLLEHVGQMEAGCRGAGGVGEGLPEHVACLEACQQARNRLDELCRVDLPRLQAEAVAGLDLSQEFTPRADPCPEATELLAQVSEMVRAADEAAKALGKVRFKFDQEASGLLTARDNALKRLEALQAETRAAILEGLDGVGEALQAACNSEERVAELQRAAQDPEGFRAAVEAFESSVAEAEKAVSRARCFRESVRREEEQMLRVAFERLPRHGQLRVAGEALLAALVAAEQDWGQAAGREPSEADARLRERLARLETELRGLGLSEAAEYQPGPQPGPGSWSRPGSWDVMCTHDLGEDISEHLPKARLLEREVSSSIRLAVEGLNSGVLRCDEGFCIVYSASRQRYFLLYEQAKKDFVFNLFKISG